jgi:16S rRNA (cytosine967-C5)-methyltransferase
MHIPSAPPLWQQLQATAKLLHRVRQGQSGTAAMDSVPAPLRAGVQALAFQAWRQMGRAAALRDRLVQRPPPPGADAMLCLALALVWDPQQAVYEEFTLVNQAVEALKRVASSRAHANFVNACLRRFLRERQQLIAATDADPQALWNHPRWWVQRMQREYPHDWQAVLLASNVPAPMTLRVNLRRGTVADYVLRLHAAGISGKAAQGAAIVLDQAVPVARLPGFAQGLVAVQDAAAQLAAPLLLQGLGRAPRILDACAAPGGKTAHLLELADLDLLALDSDPQRLARVQDGLNRLGLQADLKAGDARYPRGWWDGRPFDAILLDAPCTASGIVRRHPDVRWLRRADDINALSLIQAQMLDALWPLLAPGGRLLYATCSLFKAEGTHQIDAFMQRQPPGTARLDPGSPGHLLPSRDNGLPVDAGRSTALQDGFFYALIHKT